MKSDRSMGLMSQIETNLDDSFAAKTNTGWMSDFFLRYNQRNFPSLLRNRSRGQRLALLCLPVEVFASHGNPVARRCIQFSPLNAGAKRTIHNSHEV